MASAGRGPGVTDDVVVDSGARPHLDRDVATAVDASGDRIHEPT